MRSSPWYQEPAAKQTLTDIWKKNVGRAGNPLYSNVTLTTKGAAVEAAMFEAQATNPGFASKLFAGFRASRLARLALGTTAFGLGTFVVTEGLSHWFGDTGEGGAAYATWFFENQQARGVEEGDSIMLHNQANLKCTEYGLPAECGRIYAPKDGLAWEFDICKITSGIKQCQINLRGARDDANTIDYPATVPGGWNVIEKTFPDGKFMKVGFLPTEQAIKGSCTNDCPAGTPITSPVPNPTPTDLDIQQYLEDFLTDPENEDLAVWFCLQFAEDIAAECGTTIDPNTGESVLIKVPNCNGLTVLACEDKLVARGFVNWHTETATYLEADVEIDPEHVIDIDPDPGETINWDDELTILLNPAPDFMPVFVPDFDFGGGCPPDDPECDDDGDGWGDDGDECKHFWELNWDEAANLARHFRQQNGRWPTADELNPVNGISWDELKELEDQCAPYIGESYWSYLRRLAAAGMLGTVVFLDAEDLDQDVLDRVRDTGQTLRPGNVVKTTPGPGARRRQHPALVADPERADHPTEATGQEVQDAPQAIVEVEVLSPNSEPVAPDDIAPDPGAGGGGAPGQCGTQTVRPLDLSPLEQDPGDVFPFGVFGWVAGTFSSWAAQKEAPRVETDFGGLLPDDLVVDLAMADGALAIIHPVLIVCAFVVLLAVVASSFTKLGTATMRDEY